MRSALKSESSLERPGSGFGSRCFVFVRFVIFGVVLHQWFFAGLHRFRRAFDSGFAMVFLFLDDFFVVSDVSWI